MAAAAERLLSGLGIGWRPEIAGVVADVPDLGFTEVIAEALAPADPSRGVTELRGRGVAVVPHGVRLSLGGPEPVQRARVAHLAACAEAVGAPLVSEHVAFVRAGGREAGHLLPVPRTREALDALAANIARTQAELSVPLAVEPIAALLDWPEDEMDEGTFLRALLDRTGALLLLDVANVYANAVNRGQDPRAVLDTLPLDRIAYVHVAGGIEHDGLYHDTHTAPVPQPVLALLRDLTDRLPSPPAVMLERDGHYPPAETLRAELDSLRPASSAHPPGEFREPPRRVPHLGPASSAPALAERQKTLVTSLVADGPAPDGVDPARLDATRRALVRKRAGLAAGAWPRLAAALPDWGAVFATHILPHGGTPPGPLRDGWDVARALRDRGELPAGAERELAERESALRYDGRSDPRPRLRARLRRRW